jgi:thiol-disulfide isomerase/thioredoxin
MKPSSRLILPLVLSALALILFFSFKNTGIHAAEPVISNGRNVVTNAIDLKPAPEFTLQNQNGELVSLNSFKGKVVYMDVWATWCIPCLSEMKKGEPLKDKFKDEKDLVFLYVSIDEKMANWKSWVAKNAKPGSTHLISVNGEDEKFMSRYDVQSIPRFIIIDREGNLFYSHAPAPSSKEIEAILNETLGK